MDEVERLFLKDNGDLPKTGLAITLEIDSASRESQIFKCLVDLMKGIIKAESLDYQIDATWEENLPDWFVSKTKSISQDDLLKNDQLWDFGSWIDAMKQRGWKWWSRKILQDKVVIYLETFTYPYNIDPFFYMLYSCGVDFKNTSITEIYPDANMLRVD